MKESEILSAKIKRDIKEQEKTQEFGSNLNGSLALIQAWKLGAWVRKRWKRLLGPPKSPVQHGTKK